MRYKSKPTLGCGCTLATTVVVIVVSCPERINLRWHGRLLHFEWLVQPTGIKHSAFCTL